jgi:tetratricopeptide (TPR) repeat protein
MHSLNRTASSRTWSNLAWLKLAVLPLAATLGGCYVAQIPNPNEPELADAEIMARNIDLFSQRLQRESVERGLPPNVREQALDSYMERYLQEIDPAEIDPAQAWLYGDVYERAERWQEMETMYEIAVAQNPKKTEDFISEDRRVNDHLSLARAKAELGKVEEAIALVESVLDAAREMSAPILPATLLEIVPAARDEGHDGELAKLLEKAIAKHEETIVDPQSAAGQAFLQAKPFHIRDAWTAAARLYQNAGMAEEAQEAIRRYDQATDRFGSV